MTIVPFDKLRSETYRVKLVQTSNMFILFPFLFPFIFCQEILSTNIPPIITAHDSEHLFINFSASFTGKIDSTSDIRFRSTFGRDNLTITDNLVKTDICMNYNILYVEINGVSSREFSYFPFDETLLKKSITSRTCRKPDGDGVLFDIEGFRKETLLHDSCLKYVQFRSGYQSDQTIGPEIQNENTVVDIQDGLFRVCAQMKYKATQSILVKSSLKKCFVYEHLQQDQVPEGSTTIGVVVGALVLFVCLVIIIVYFKLKKKATNTDIDQNPEYGQQEYYQEYEQKRTNIVEDNEEYDGGAYTTDQECYVKDTNNAYADY